MDEANGLKGVIKYSADTKTGLTSYFTSSRNDVVRGSIYKYDKKKHLAVVNKQKDKWFSMLKDLAEMPDSIKEIHKVEGSWLREIRCDGELLWSADSEPQYAQQHFFLENPLPSDCRFREDLVWLWKRNEDQSGSWKVKLEEQQRHERALRKKAQEGKSPRH